jgi:predicted transposase/invertase (TIGR01784 family)
LWEWGRFFTIKSEEELDMTIDTASPPVAAAAGRLKELSRDEAARRLYEARLDQQRLQHLRDRDEHEQGRAEGRAEGETRMALAALKAGFTIDEVVTFSGFTREQLQDMLNR